MITRRLQALLFATALIISANPASAQDADELARQTQNPVANLITVPFEANWDMGIGDREATGTILNFQPVVPFELTLPKPGTTPGAKSARVSSPPPAAFDGSSSTFRVSKLAEI